MNLFESSRETSIAARARLHLAALLVALLALRGLAAQEGTAPPAKPPVAPAAGTPAAGTPAAGTPAAGTPAAGTPATGTSAAGTPAGDGSHAQSAEKIGVSPKAPLTPAPQSTGRYGLKPPPLNFNPPIVAIKEPVYDWGSVLQGEVVVHDFAIENSGGAPLRIEKVRPICGCTTVDYDKEIAPGASGKITLKIETTKFSGAVKKTADIDTNAGRAALQLAMQGNVDPAVNMDPKVPTMSVVRGVETEPLVIALTKASKYPFQVKGLTPKSEVVQATLSEVQPGERYEVKVVPKLADDAKKYHYAQIDAQIEVNDKKFDLPIRVTITVKERIEANPSSVYFSRRDTEPLEKPGAPPATKTVSIKSIDPKHSFKITDVQVQGTHFEHRLETVTEGKEYNLVVLLPALPKDDKRRIAEKIIVRTDDPNPQLSEITVNATAQVGKTVPTGTGARPLVTQPPAEGGATTSPAISKPLAEQKREAIAPKPAGGVKDASAPKE